MTLFHEMYGAYFRIAARVLGESPLTDRRVQEIITKEGGYIKVVSKPGKGSEFLVFLKKQTQILQK